MQGRVNFRSFFRARDAGLRFAAQAAITKENSLPTIRISDKSKLKMAGWQIHSYGEVVEELQYSEKLKVPQIRCASECLVRVHSTSVNPIDVAMVGGYGSKVLKVLRCQPNEIEFPIILGREFCGYLLQRGMGVNSDINVGDRVWGVVPVHRNGAHAEYVAVPDYCLSRAPKSLSNEEAAAVLYAGLTAWSGLYITAGLDGFWGAFCADGKGTQSIQKRVLVLGGAGSVGSLAIQMLKVQGAQVIATCSEDAKDLVCNHGADYTVDYKNPAEMETLRSYAPFDVVLDCAGQGALHAQAMNLKFRQYITFSSPVLRNIDNSGIGLGLLKNVADLLETNAIALRNQGGVVKWGFFTTAPQGIKFLYNLVDRKKMLPSIDCVYNFNQLPDAFKRVQAGHLRGKVIVNLN